MKANSFVCDFETTITDRVDINLVSIATFAPLTLKDKWVEKFEPNSKTLKDDNLPVVEMFDDISNYIKKKTRANYVELWFNNSSGYDNYYIIENLFKLGYKQSLTRINAKSKGKYFNMLAGNSIKILEISFVYNDVMFITRDFLRYSLMSVKKLGQTLGINKLDDIGDKYYMKEWSSLSQIEKDEYVKYANRDIEILWHGIKLFNEFISLDTKSKTISGIAINSFKKQYPWEKEKMIIPYEKWFRAHYNGGYTKGNVNYQSRTIQGDIKCYDLNSAYPFAMINKHPVGEPLDEWDIDEKEKESLSKLYYIKIERALLKKGLNPIIRDKGKQNEYFKQIIQPLYYWVWDIELKWFEQYYQPFKYSVIEIKYFKTDSIFSKSILELYKTKESASKKLKENLDTKERNYYEMQKEVSKRVMNCFYGKLAQRPVFESWYITPKLYEKGDTFTHKIYYKEKTIIEKYKITSKKTLKLGDDLQVYTIIAVDSQGNLKTPNKCANIFIASYITSFVRCLLFELIYELKERFLYSDTDSIYCIGEIPERFIDAERLGAWKLERNDDKYFRALGAKCYISSKTKTISKDKNISKITIAGVNNYSNIYNKSIDNFRYGLEFSKKSTKKISQGFIFKDVIHKIQPKGRKKKWK